MASERVQPPPPSMEYMKAKRSGEAKISDHINAGKWEGYTPPALPEK
jgi:ribonuclease Z